MAYTNGNVDSDVNKWIIQRKTENIVFAGLEKDLQM